MAANAGHLAVTPTRYASRCKTSSAENSDGRKRQEGKEKRTSTFEFDRPPITPDNLSPARLPTTRRRSRLAVVLSSVSFHRSLLLVPVSLSKVAAVKRYKEGRSCSPPSLQHIAESACE